MKERIVESPSMARKSHQTWYLSEVSLHEGQERPLSDAVKVKPRFYWKFQGIVDATGVVHLPRKAADRFEPVQERSLLN